MRRPRRAPAPARAARLAADATDLPAAAELPNPWSGLRQILPRLAQPKVWRLIAPSHTTEIAPPPAVARALTAERQRRFHRRQRR